MSDVLLFILTAEGVAYMYANNEQ